MGFASFADQIGRNLDYRDTYFSLKTALGDGNNEGLHNWKRIWNCVENIANIAVLLIRAGGIQGRSITLNPAPGSTVNFVRGDRVYANDKGDECLTVGKPHRQGCRRLYRKSFILPSSSKCRIKIGISTIAFDAGIRYICGFRLLDDQGRGPQPVGLIVPNAESVYKLKASEGLYGIDVLLVSTGVIGLRFLTGNAPHKTSDWFGTTPDPRRTDTGRARLLADGNQSIRGLWLGLDACKVVSLGLLTKESPAESRPVQQFRWTDPSSPNKFTWKPHPPHHLKTASQISPPLVPNAGKYQVRFNMDFGGVRGELLDKLIGITASTNDRREIIGTGFVYHEELVKSFGTGSGHVQEIKIDGPNGERIVKVEVHTGPPILMANPALHQGYFVRIFTNFSNTYDFGDRNESRAMRKPLPQPTPEQAEILARLDREEVQVETILDRLERRIVKPAKLVDELVCKEGEIIIGLIASEGDMRGDFSKISMMTYEVEKKRVERWVPRWTRP